MTTFKQFLQEKIITKWSSNEVTRDEALILLNKHCRDGLKAVQHRGLLFRGFSKSLGWQSVLDSSTLKRTSLDTNNLYQIMMDSSESLKNYPKRSSSFICSTYFYDASDYGGYVYAMIPFDGTKVATASVRDFFNTEVSSPLLNEPTSIDNIGFKLSDAFGRLGVKRSKANPQFTNMSEIDAVLSKVDVDVISKVITKAYGTTDFNEKKVEKVLGSADTNERATALASALITEKSLGMKLNSFGDALPKCEAWFSGKCVAIEIHAFISILKQLRDQDFPIHDDYLDLISM